MNIKEIAEALDNVQGAEAIRGADDNNDVPSRIEIAAIIRGVQAVLFPGYFAAYEDVSCEKQIAEIHERLKKQIKCSFSFSGVEECDSDGLADEFISALPVIKSTLLKDVEALYEGDPAAKCREEVLICYPGFFAICVYRMAHVLYKLRVPLLPRMMTEYVHGKTGIDIHAGAQIGEYFFIDHGTGIVIGETTVIGDHVKLYQGVTLGAKSFELDESGNPVKNIKRHPNIGNNVVIYANATILGGRTFIGDNCIIGGNVWLTESVPAGKKIYYTEKH